VFDFISGKKKRKVSQPAAANRLLLTPAQAERKQFARQRTTEHTITPIAITVLEKLRPGSETADPAHGEVVEIVQQAQAVIALRVVGESLQGTDGRAEFPRKHVRALVGERVAVGADGEDLCLVLEHVAGGVGGVLGDKVEGCCGGSHEGEEGDGVHFWAGVVGVGEMVAVDGWWEVGWAIYRVLLCCRAFVLCAVEVRIVLTVTLSTS
jgi:hypothetical protein